MTAPKKAPAASQTATPKPPKKLIPRPAAKAKTATEAVPAAAPAPTAEPAQVATPATASATEKIAAQPAAAKAAAPKTAAKPAIKKPSALDEINAKNKKAMVDALAKAQAVKIAQPLGRPLPPPELPKSKKAGKAEKPVKHKKPKLVRDSYAMPEAEYAQIAVLKKRLAGLGQAVKKSELLRGGVAALVALNDAELQAVMGRVDRIKTGRPAK